jgi:hypothetical protein
MELQMDIWQAHLKHYAMFAIIPVDRLLEGLERCGGRLRLVYWRDGRDGWRRFGSHNVRRVRVRTAMVRREGHLSATVCGVTMLCLHLPSLLLFTV